jgi:hypothetical protein
MMDAIDQGVKIPPIIALESGLVTKKLEDKGNQGGNPRYLPRPKAALPLTDPDEAEGSPEEPHLIDVLV